MRHKLTNKIYMQSFSQVKLPHMIMLTNFILLKKNEISIGSINIRKKYSARSYSVLVETKSNISTNILTFHRTSNSKVQFHSAHDWIFALN